MRNIAENLLAVRNSKKLLQKDVAAQTGVTATALSAYEKGQREPSLSVVVRLAEFYGVSIDWLCGVEHKPEEKKPEDMTRADVVKTLYMLKKNVPESSIRCNSTYDAERGEYVYRLDFMIESTSNWATAYFEKLSALLSLYRSGDIDAEVLEAWNEKKFNEPIYKEPIAQNPCSTDEDDAYDEVCT